MERIAEDAALLERALREDWPRERSELRELLARRPDWAALLAGPDQVPESRGPAAEGDRRLVDELLALARLREVGTRTRAPRRLARGGWLLAAAAVLILGGLWWIQFGGRSNAPGLDEGQELGPASGRVPAAELSCVAPEGAASTFSVFEWLAERNLEPDETYVVTVYSVDERGAVLGELLRETTDRTTWEPEAEDVERWPKRILWRVRRMTDGGTRTGFAEALAER
jgi:hypothetical protein